MGGLTDFISSIPGVSTAIDLGKTYWSADYNSDENTANRNWQTDQAAVNREFQKEMRATQYQTAVKDMQAAGLNPMLAYSQGGAGNLQGSTPSGGGGPAAHPGESTTMGIAALQQSAAQVQLVNAQRDLISAQTKETEARTPTYAVTIEATRQSIVESLARINEITARISLHGSSTAVNMQQIENLKAEIPKINATISNLSALTVEAIQRAGKTKAEAIEIHQRIQQDLPKLHALQTKVDIALKEPQVHIAAKQTTDQDAGYGVLGHLGAIARILNPLNNFLPSGKY